jgi:pyruvate dehydrogenase (quinone)
VNYGIDLDTLAFAPLGRFIGLHGVSAEKLRELDAGLQQAFDHFGPPSSTWRGRQELSLSPKVTAEQLKGFMLYATRTILSGGGNEVLELLETNLRGHRPE